MNVDSAKWLQSNNSVLRTMDIYTATAADAAVKPHRHTHIHIDEQQKDQRDFKQTLYIKYNVHRFRYLNMNYNGTKI